MTEEELAFAPATQLLELISTKQVSPVELTEIYYRRIDRLDSRLNSYLTLAYDEAMETAKWAETAVIRGNQLGPLHGLPISVKDLQMTKGVRTTHGSLLFKDRVPDRDCAVVERLRSAGSVMIGKTNVPEFGLTGTCENLLGDHGRNPWDTGRTPGGSSGGAAAATSAGLCALATGGDGGGSIRIPASFSGVFGIKPTQGRVSGYSGVDGPPAPNQFSQQGPMSRTVRDSALLLQVLAGHDIRDPVSLRTDVPDFVGAVNRDIKRLRVCWSPDYGFAPVDPEVVEITCHAALIFEELGCDIDEPDFVMESPYDAFGPIFNTSVYSALGRYLESHRGQLTYFSRHFIELGSQVTASGYARALGVADRLKAQMDRLFEKYDLLLSPTLATTALPVGEWPDQIAGRPVSPNKYFSFFPFTYPINVIGHPAASILAGFSSDGLPIGLHIVGRMGEEETVIAASAAFERAKPWIHLRPSVS